VPDNLYKERLEQSKSIIVIGGGRWARVMVSVLYDFLPEDVNIIVYSKNNFKLMLEWIQNELFSPQVTIINKLNHVNINNIKAAIVVNSAKDHYRFSKFFIQKRIPVLIEKPISLSFLDVQKISFLSKKFNSKIGTSQIFMFASYLRRFKSIISKAGDIDSLNLDWHDSSFENRYGESKQYDASVPVYLDCLPHILMIISYLLDKEVDQCNSLIFKDGGASLTLDFSFIDTKCTVNIQRNALTRKRFISAKSNNKVIKLDFSIEPGTISGKDFSMSGDEQWEIKEGPLSIMLRSFIEWSTGGENKEFFDINQNVSIYKVIDQVGYKYKKKKNIWLSSCVSNNTIYGKDIDYAIREVLLIDGCLSGDSLNEKNKMNNRLILNKYLLGKL
jgi:hypothetical protein